MPVRSFASLILGLVAGAASVHAQPAVTVEFATPGVTFTKPVGVEAAPGQREARLYVLEQGDRDDPSRIMTLVPGDAQATVFLDITDRVETDGEAGLLGLAFHPDYPANGRLFVNYTAPPDGQGALRTRVSEFARSSTDPLQADPASERIVLDVVQPALNHNGGTVAFGPDGMLYVGFGDGGGQGDPFGNGQNPATLLGSIVRIDVDNVPPSAAYGIPSDNPFAAGTGTERAEIWAYGFRNPFKFDVSPSGLWVGDVGEARWEEVNRVEKGGNYGWNQVEGPVCFRPGCDLSAYQAPIVSYPHTAEGGFSITGGVVFDAPDTELTGHYLYGDFVTGRLWALRLGDTQPSVLLETVPNVNGGQRRINISSIDAVPDLIVTDYSAGILYRVIPHSTRAEGPPGASPLAVRLDGANPARGSAAIRVESREPVRVTVVDALGRNVGVLWDGPGPPPRLLLDGDLAPGLYTVRAVAGRQSAAVRVVKVR